MTVIAPNFFGSVRKLWYRNRLTTIVLITIGVFGAVVCNAAGLQRRVVELQGPGSVGTLSIGGHHVGDLAAADRLLVGVSGGGRGAVTTAARSVRAADASVERSLCDGRILVVDLAEGSDILSAAREMEQRAGVAFAEPDRVVYLNATPDDPEYEKQPHLPKISCPNGWDIETGSRDVVIAVIDSGVDLDHPDLEGFFWTNTDEIPDNGVDDDDNGYADDVHGWDFHNGNNNVEAVPDGEDENNDGTPDEQVNHGTLAAGIATAAANGFGTVGVSWEATIMPLKVFPDDGTTFVSTVVDAMDYAVDNGADIMNLSIGAPYEESFTAPITELWQRGGLTVSAGGNSGKRITESQSTWISPTCNNGPNPTSDNMNIGVGGLTLQDRKASWSNYDGSVSGNFVDVFAPGVNIYGPGVYEPSVTGFDSYFTSNSGTSFAAPMVSGLAALLMAQDPSRSGSDVLQVILDSCDDIDWRNPGYEGELGRGRINVARALGSEVPAGAPTDLRAYDTEGDQGGSITLNWTKSPDDGGGSNSVTGYDVERAVGSLPSEVGSSEPSDSEWGVIASLVPGTDSYVDDNTTDGARYFYRVAAVYDAGRSYSDAVGPVFSYDDTAPPRVENLRVYDRPVDDGGAIVVDWTEYGGSADIASFDVFRSEWPFNSVLGMTPLTGIEDGATRSYTDTSTTDGVDYYYAVVPTDGEGNQRKDVVAAGPVQSFANGPVSFAAGMYLMSTPVVPADRHPASLFDISGSSLHYARYDNGTGEYVKYQQDPLPELLELELGNGFWVRFDDRVEFVPRGSVAPAGNYTRSVAPGWRLVGNPFPGNLDFSASTVTVGNNTMDLESANTRGVVRSYGWSYDTENSAYELLHAVLGSDTTVEPWEGFWVRVDQSCDLTLVRPTRGADAGSSDFSLEDQWPVQLIARGGGSVDDANYFGVCDVASGIECPPRGGNGVDLYFLSQGGSGSDTRYATAFSASESNSMSWRFNVRPGSGCEVVCLSWPDLSNVPSEYNLTLEDLDSGQRISMRHRTGYRLNGAGSDGGTRHFAIDALRNAGNVLQITSAGAHATDGGAQIVFSLSRSAVCDISIMNIAGRRIANVAKSERYAAGTSTAVWSGRATGGARVPAGQYLVRIRARGDEGRKLSTLRHVRMNQ